MDDADFDQVLRLFARWAQDTPSLALLEDHEIARRSVDRPDSAGAIMHFMSASMQDELAERLEFVAAYLAQVPLSLRDELRLGVGYGEPPVFVKPALADVIEYYLYHGMIREVFRLFSGTSLTGSFAMFKQSSSSAPVRARIPVSDIDRLRLFYGKEGCNDVTSRETYAAIVDALRNDPFINKGKVENIKQFHLRSMIASRWPRMVYAAARGGFPVDFVVALTNCISRTDPLRRDNLKVYCLGLLDQQRSTDAKGRIELTSDFIQVLQRADANGEDIKASSGDPQYLIFSLFNLVFDRAILVDDAVLVDTLFSLCGGQVENAPVEFFLSHFRYLYTADVRFALGPNMLAFYIAFVRRRQMNTRASKDFLLLPMMFADDENIEIFKKNFEMGTTDEQEDKLKRVFIYSTRQMNSSRLNDILFNFRYVALTDTTAVRIADWFVEFKDATTELQYRRLREWTLVSLRPDLMSVFDDCFSAQIRSDADDEEIHFSEDFDDDDDDDLGRAELMRGKHSVDVSAGTLLMYLNASKSLPPAKLRLPIFARIKLDRQWVDDVMAGLLLFKQKNPRKAADFYFEFLEQCFCAVPDRRRYDVHVRYFLDQLKGFIPRNDWRALYVNVMAGMRSNTTLIDILSFSDLGELAQHVVHHLKLSRAHVLTLLRESNGKAADDAKNPLYRREYDALVNMYRDSKTDINVDDYKFLLGYGRQLTTTADRHRLRVYQRYNMTCAVSRVYEAVALLMPVGIGHLAFGIGNGVKDDSFMPALTLDTRMGLFGYNLREQLNLLQNAIRLHSDNNSIMDFLFDDFIKFIRGGYSTFWRFLR